VLWGVEDDETVASEEGLHLLQAYHSTTHLTGISEAISEHGKESASRVNPAELPEKGTGALSRATGQEGWNEGCSLLFTQSGIGGINEAEESIEEMQTAGLH
jgi:hypothetical protein